MKNFSMAIGLIFLLSGCASPDSMTSKHGLVKTAAFDPLFIASTKNSVTNVKYKTATLMFKKEMPAFAILKDTLVIADSGIFLVEWDTNSLNFHHKLELPFSEISEVKSVINERNFLPNSQYLKVTTVKNEHYNFAIFDETVELSKRLIESQLSR
tara:strand:- start:158 stop:622 length:465 start_codon:yes stop_codon:yes gene_type:complete